MFTVLVNVVVTKENAVTVDETVGGDRGDSKSLLDDVISHSRAINGLAVRRQDLGLNFLALDFFYGNRAGLDLFLLGRGNMILETRIFEDGAPSAAGRVG